MKTTFIALILSLMLTTISQAEVKTKKIEYIHNGVTLEGLLAWDDSIKEKRPGILIIHDWNGLGSYEQKRAKQVAELGYVSFALDMYGKGVRPKNPKESGQESAKYKNDRQLMRARAQAGLNVLKKSTKVNKEALAAMGYCFGGTTTLELARSGANIKGAISFHGHLDTPNQEDAKAIKGKILVLHGADDPYVPKEQIEDFQKEMTAANVNWQLTKYSQAVHSFTNPEAGNDNSKGAAYNQLADKRSWQAMRQFFQEIFQ